jgi:uncharacterized protein YcfL
MKKLLLIAVLFVGCRSNQDNIDDDLRMVMERAYFCGQRDAINGVVVIKFDTDDSLYKWKDSPWNSRRETLYKMTKDDNKVLKYESQ